MISQPSIPLMMRVIRPKIPETSSTLPWPRTPPAVPTARTTPIQTTTSIISLPFLLTHTASSSQHYSSHINSQNLLMKKEKSKSTRWAYPGSARRCREPTNDQRRHRWQATHNRSRSRAILESYGPPERVQACAAARSVEFSLPLSMYRWGGRFLLLLVLLLHTRENVTG